MPCKFAPFTKFSRNLRNNQRTRYTANPRFGAGDSNRIVTNKRKKLSRKNLATRGRQGLIVVLFPRPPYHRPSHPLHYREIFPELHLKGKLICLGLVNNWATHMARRHRDRRAVRAFWCFVFTEYFFNQLSQKNTLSRNEIKYHGNRCTRAGYTFLNIIHQILYLGDTFKETKMWIILFQHSKIFYTNTFA